MTAAVAAELAGSQPSSPGIQQNHIQYGIVSPSPTRFGSTPPSLSLPLSRSLARSAPPVLTMGAPAVAKIIDPTLNDTLVSSPNEFAVDTEEAEAPYDRKVLRARMNRAGSVGNSWGISSVGKGFDWRWKDSEPATTSEDEGGPLGDPSSALGLETNGSRLETIGPRLTLNIPNPPLQKSPSYIRSIGLSSLTTSPQRSIPSTPSHSRPLSPSLGHPMYRSPSSPRPRRRSSQKRISLVAGRLSMLSISPPPSPDRSSPDLSAVGNSPKLSRLSSTSSFMSVGSSVAAPPTPRSETWVGVRSIDDFAILGEAGRGAYGLVKRGKEKREDGSYGPLLIIKQIIKSRILADCWKKHPNHGTIPIEIYVMSALSSTSYKLPAPRPWDPLRFNLDTSSDSDDDESTTPITMRKGWHEGDVVQGHPNICPLIEFFEDRNYYYLILPSSTPRSLPPPNPPPPGDLFDLVELHPQGLPPHLIRSYIGQIADALSFLHARGIVHRDIKDENVVLGPHDGQCWLIDFGSSGVVRRGGWDTFSGTLDYAGPEILRGERYSGKEQDVWAFGVVAYVLLVGECPFTTAAEAQEGLVPGSKAAIALDERCASGRESEGEEPDGGGQLGDAATLVQACLKVEVTLRPTFDKILTHRFLAGSLGWISMDEPQEIAV